MRLLKSCSGNKSVGKVAETSGYEVTSLGLKNADININILKSDSQHKHSLHKYDPDIL